MDEIPRLEALRIKNYRALRDITLTRLTPLTVFLGPNGSGKSTIFDVFAFLSECFSEGLRKAWDRRGRFEELRSRDAIGNIEFELKYRETTTSPLITYHLSIGEHDGKQPYVMREFLEWQPLESTQSAPFRFLDFENGSGRVVNGASPDERASQSDETLASPEVLAVNALGQLAKNPRIGALQRFITDWYLSHITAESSRTIPPIGTQERLSFTGDNLANVIQYLGENHPDQLQQILKRLSERIPRLERVDVEILQGGALSLQVKDAPFEKPILAKFASDGTLKLLAYLIVLHGPNVPRLIGIEEPENQLHPRLLQGLAEECRYASAKTQLMVTTHSPFFVNGLRAEELWVLYRNSQGYTQVRPIADLQPIHTMLAEGALLGDLWMEGFFGVGDPLINMGDERKRIMRP